MTIFPEHLARFSKVTPFSESETINPNKKSYRHTPRKASTGQRFGFELETIRFSYDKAIELQTFLESLGFDFVRFDLKNPMETLGLGGGTPQTRSEVLAGTSNIPIDLLPISQTDTWRIGDYVQFANHKKAYKVQVNMNSNGSGQGTATIYPPLIEDVPVSTSILHGPDVYFQVELINEVNDIGYSVANRKRVPIDINVIEVG